MEHILASLCLLECVHHSLSQCTPPISEFQLEGDYLIGGLFNIHHVNEPNYHDRPEAIDCSSQPLMLPNYRRFQIMRFAVGEINNSTKLLPNVSLGYQIFDHCSNTQSYPGVLNLISVNGLIKPWKESNKNRSAVSKVIAVSGLFSSTESLTVAPLVMADLIPMVSYGSTSSVFSKKKKFPSFLRTVHSNKDIIKGIVEVIQHFKWRWVAFLNIDNEYGNDGLDLFKKMSKNTEICLAYTKSLDHHANYSEIFKKIDALGIKVIIAFTDRLFAETLVVSAVNLNVTNKVWIAGDAWALNMKLLKAEGIQKIGTVLGLTEEAVTIPGFNDFIHSSKCQGQNENLQEGICNQVCNCRNLSAQDILSVDPSFSFPVYSAVYAIAYALHNALQCGAGKCNGNIKLDIPMVLAELKKSKFTLLNQTVEFNDHGDPMNRSYSIVFWNRDGNAEVIGFYKFQEGQLDFHINATKIQWYTNGEVLSSLCSPECPAGYAKWQTGIHKCCFSCKRCPKGTFMNITENPYMCLNCKETEWSTLASTSCSLREVVYIPLGDTVAVLIMAGACILVGLTFAVCVLFAINYNGPVVRSAGGPMCFLILGCLSLCSLCVFFYFGRPTIFSCTLRILPFLLFYAVCLACFAVRSFQIVCIFKMTATFPKLHSWWGKYQGQWLVITAASVIQAFLVFSGYSVGPPKPFNDTLWYPDKIILDCDIKVSAFSASGIFLACLGGLCFVFSYMGKDLPKNYNEAKAITFCLLLLVFTWALCLTENTLYRGKYIQSLNALAILSSQYSFLLWYFLPKCYIIIFQPHKNTQQYFQGLIQNYTKTISQ